MSVIANVSVPAEEFALGGILDVCPEPGVMIEAMVPTREAVMPYFWASSDVADAIETTLCEDQYVESVTLVDKVDGDTLFLVEWAPEIDGFVDAILENDAVMMKAVGASESWSFQLRFGGYDALSAFYRQCVDADIPIELHRIHNPVASDQPRRFGLTPAQREVLRVAADEGYFEVPRETTLVQLGDTLDISDSAVSQRMRRGLTTLISSTLLNGTHARPNDG